MVSRTSGREEQNGNTGKTSSKQVNYALTQLQVHEGKDKGT